MSNRTDREQSGVSTVAQEDLCSVARALGFDPQPVSLSVASGIGRFPGGSAATDATAAEYRILGEAAPQTYPYPLKLGKTFDGIECASGRKVVICQGLNENSRGLPLFLTAVLRRLPQDSILKLRLLGIIPDQTLLYATDPLHGNPWADRIDSLALPANLNILLTVAGALDFANSQGVIHTNVTPVNVCVNDDGGVLLTHWSYVILTADFPESELCNQYRNQLGYSPDQAGFTPAYAAPELVNHDVARITERTLVYQCGALLFKIVSGQSPHEGQDSVNRLTNAANNILRHVEHSGELISIAHQAMQTNPEDRYATLKEFQAVLKRYLSHNETT